MNASVMPRERTALATGPQPTVAPLRVLVVAHPAAIDRYPTGIHAKTVAHTTRDAIRLIEEVRPAIVAIEWNLDGIDRGALCQAAGRFPVAVLAILQAPQDAPAAIRAGCHAVLLEPIAPTLAATRIARLAKQMESRLRYREAEIRGTHRAWTGVACPQCGTDGATSFECAGRRKAWLACLQCAHVWVGPEPC